jgi:multiple sugar transport system permease protein
MFNSTRMMRIRREMLPYALMLPAALALLAFSIYPFLSGIWYSFTSIGWVNDTAKFVGLDNYKIIFEGDFGSAALFKSALLRSIYWTVATVGGQFVLGLFTALILNEKFPGRAIFRIAILVSIAVPTVILALTWYWMYDPFYGLINFYLQKVGLLSGPKIWVGQSNSPIWPLIVVGIWRGFPFMSLMLLSGLQGIPDELYEAAKVDGANVLARFIHITLPQLRTIIVIALMLHTLWWWNHFDIIKIVGDGSSGFGYGTATIPYLAWYEAFQWSHLSRGAAISVIAMLMIGGIIFWNARRELRSVTNK